MKISKELYGCLETEEVYEYTLTNSSNLSLSIISYGGIITGIKMPDRDGEIEEITINLENLDEIVKSRPFHGAIIGPVAGRIAKGQYLDDDRLIKLDRNEGENTLHSGYNALDTRNWEVETNQQENDVSLILRTTLKEGEAGFPGNIDVKVTYTLNEKGEMIISYEAESDKRTLFNPTNHVYFNLSGNTSKPIYDHKLRLNSDYYAVLDDANIPTGELRKVDESAFDFREEKELLILKETSDEAIRKREGFDHPFLLNKKANKLAAKLYHKESGRLLEIRTECASAVIFTHNQELKTPTTRIGQHCGIAIETSELPDAVNQKDFGSIWLEKGEQFKSETVFKFSTL